MTMGFKSYARTMTQKLERMDFPITSAATAEDILKGLEAKGIAPPAVTNVLTAKIGRMAAIEVIDQNFVRPEYIAQVSPGEEFDRVYILKATRHFSSIASYTVAFDVKLAWGGSAGSSPHVQRIMSRSTSFNVTPSPITLSAVAAGFGLLGTVVNSIATLEGYSNLISIELIKKYFIASVLALVVVNSLEMTEFKGRVGSISWRSAMFIGILCGLLSDKMLKAITSFVQ
jgi:hypothetical protein